jgi:hypothetical protein
MQYQILESYRQGSLEAMWSSLKTELIQADHFNNGEELPFNEAQQDRLGEIAAAVLVVIADSEIRQLEDNVRNDLTPENEALYDFWQSDQYNLKRDLQDLSGNRQMITDTYNVRDVIEA